MSKFEWHTEDDDDWLDNELPPKSGRSISLRWLLVPILVLGGIFIWQGIQRQIGEAEISAENDVRATFDLLHDASGRGDLELVNRLMSGADLEWSQAQQELVSGNGLLDRSALNLERIPDDVNISSLVVGHDLVSAVITSTSRYQYNGQVLTLNVASIFRRGNDRWLYAPPEPEWWGVNEVVQRSGLSIQFPERDAPLMRSRLINDLAAIDFGIYATTPVEVGIEFSIDPTSLLRPGLLSADSTFIDIMVPTPSLLGVPVTEADYLALREVYADIIGEVISAEFTQFATDPEQSLPVSNSPHPPLPIPLPSSEIALACTKSGISNIYGITPGSNNRRAIRTDVFDNLSVRSLPQQDGLWIQGRDPRNVGILYDDIISPLPDAMLIGAWPLEDNAIQVRVDKRNDDAPGYVIAIQPQLCYNGLCNLNQQGLGGEFVFSPNEANAFIQTVKNDESVVSLFYDDVEGRQITIPTTQPLFWISNYSFAWRHSETDYKRYDIEDDQTYDWLGLNNVRFLLSTTPEFSNPSVTITPAGNRAFPGQLVMQVHQGGVPLHTLLVDVMNDQLEHVGKLSHASFMKMSPGGLWLISTVVSADGESLSLQFYNQFTNQLRSVPITSYANVQPLANDEDWFLVLDSDSLRLIAPDYGYVRDVELPQSGCRSAAWLN